MKNNDGSALKMEMTTHYILLTRTTLNQRLQRGGLQLYLIIGGNMRHQHRGYDGP